MVSKRFKLRDTLGFHVRPAGLFSTEMGRYQCEVWVYYQSTKICGKSIMNLVAAGIPCGAEIEVCCDGTDEQQALARAAELIESGLGE